MARGKAKAVGPASIVASPDTAADSSDLQKVRQRTRTRAKSFFSFSQRSIKGLYITGLSTFCVLLVVSVLTAHLFQHAVRSAEQNNVGVSIWKLVDARDSWKAEKLRKEEATRSYAELSVQYESASSELAKEFEKKRAMEVATINAAAKLNKHLKDAGATNEEVLFISQGAVPRRLQRYKDLVATRALADEQTKLLMATYDKSLGAELQFIAQSDFNKRENSVEDLKRAVETAKAEVDSLKNNLSQFLTGIKVKEAEEGVYGDLLNQLDSLDRISAGALGNLATMEPDLLTLLLVLAMGTLGGTLHLAKLFVEDQPSVNMGYYFYRPFLGGIVALVVFVVARSGIFIIAEPNMQSGGAMLSPFFVSFLAIVSGLLAERAISAIQDRGLRWLASSGRDDVKRYAIRVKEEAEKQGKAADFMSAAGCLSKEEVKALYEGTPAVSGDTQRLVSFALGKPIRELFTDIAPESANA